MYLVARRENATNAREFRGINSIVIGRNYPRKLFILDSAQCTSFLNMKFSGRPKHVRQWQRTEVASECNAEIAPRQVTQCLIVTVAVFDQSN